MKLFLIILLIILSYLIGSIPVGYLFVKIKKNIDIREYGSHNIGATNVARILGKKYGALIGILDILKAIFIILILYSLTFFKVDISLVRDININNNSIASIISLYGFAAVVGHTYSIFLKFKGGKAVSCSIAVILATEPLIGLIGITIFLIILLITKYVSLASLLGTLSVFIYTPVYNVCFNTPNNLVLIKYVPSDNFLASFNNSLIIIIVASLCSILIFVKHKDNIIRLFKGEENKSK